jgi:uncharacterized phage infection (PIP) family protein YhgE
MSSKTKNVFVKDTSSKRSNSRERQRDADELDSESEQVYMSKRKYYQRLKDEAEKYNQCWKEGTSHAYEAKLNKEKIGVYAEALQKVNNEKSTLTQKVRNLESEIHNQKAKIKQAQVPTSDSKSIQKNVADINKEVEDLYNKSGVDEIKRLRASLGLEIE